MAADVTALRETTLAEERSTERTSTVGSVLHSVLNVLASLKLTVVLFALSIFLVFVSTLAQTEHDIWEIVNNWYRIDERKVITETAPWIHPSELFVWIRLQYFFPHSFFPDMGAVNGGFWFPRGWLIGMAMGINLLAAHAVRFTAQARGVRLAAGLGVIGLGCFATWAAIQSGASSDGILGGAVISWDLFRKLLTMSVATLGIGLAVVGFMLTSRRVVERVCAFIAAAVCAALVGYLLYYGRAGHIEDESARILWQLLKGTGAGLILLAGCRLVFQKRAGIVLLHGGVGLMFAYEVIVGTSHQEAEMTLVEGQTSNWVQDTRSTEFVVVRKAADAKASDTAIVVPPHMLDEGATIELPEPAPFNAKIVKYVPNSDLAREGKAMENPATKGLGTQVEIVAREPGTGTDTSGKVDLPSMYVELLKKSDGSSLGTFLVSWLISTREGIPDQTVEVDGATYAVDFRPKRTYKPYDITLKEVRKDDYVAGDKPRNYSSLLRIVDSGRGIDREESIRMNNPMRFADATFYQQGYQELSDGRKVSTVQVVDNVGWMLPYVSCMIVVVGCIAQFGTTLMRFLNRRQAAVDERSVEADLLAAPSRIPAAARRSAKKAEPPPLPERSSGWVRYGIPAGSALLILAFAAALMRPARTKDGEMNLYEFGKLPVAYESRVKPFDSMARSTLSYLSQRQTFKENLDDDKEKSKPATRWLLDVMTDVEKANKYQIFRVDNLEVLETLSLKRNRHSRYSYNDIVGQAKPFIDAVEKAKAKGNKVNSFDREILKLDARISTYRLIFFSFADPGFEKITEEEFNADPKAGAEKIGKLRDDIGRTAGLVEEMLAKMKPPLPVPDGSEKWQMYAAANLSDFLARSFDADKINPATEKFRAMLDAYKKNDSAAFNAAVVDYRSYLDGHPPHEYDEARRNQETYMNKVEPFWWCSWFYLLGFGVSALGWLGWSKVFNRAAFAIICTTFVLHAAAIAWRIYITERPPVINLYSSAVFIAAGIAMFGIIFEAVYKLGVGNVVAGIAGFGSLQIANLLSLQGDHIEALQAVLDTQFWLTTHVVCITLGYAVTYAAGLLGAIYVIWGLVTTNFTQQTSKELARMIYGMLCFALVFSFFGTVLGGLWADDSWGRFWGWDPKENGALIIVLWNALVLHARWDGWIKDRGLAVLAVAGNITTSWSWFGVNQLGVGLHAYGFSQELLDVLFWFVTVSSAIVLAGTLPRKWWMSSRNLGAT